MSRTSSVPLSEGSLPAVSSTSSSCDSDHSAGGGANVAPAFRSSRQFSGPYEEKYKFAADSMQSHRPPRPAPGAKPSPPRHHSADLHSASVSVTGPRHEEEEEGCSYDTYRHNPYSMASSRVLVLRAQSFPVHSQPSQPVVSRSASARPPLAPPTASSRQERSSLSGAPVTNLRLSTSLHHQSLPISPRWIGANKTPRSLNSARSMEGGLSSSRSEAACGLSSVAETPRSSRTNAQTPRSNISTPRDLPESLDGPYRNLAGLGGDHQQPVEVQSMDLTGAESTASDSSPMMPAFAQGRTIPLPPGGTLHESLMTVVDFCQYPTQAFQAPGGCPLTGSRSSTMGFTRMFIGQLPYNVTEMQLEWLAYTFASGARLHRLEKITKLDRTKKKQLPTGCYHFYAAPQHVDLLMVGLHKKILIDDTGVWVAKDERQDRILKAYSEQMKNDRGQRFVGRPYGTLVIQRSTSTFDPETSAQA